MEEAKLTPIKEEIKRVLGDKIDDAKIDAELHKYLDEYHVDAEAAKRGIIRKYGGTDGGFASSSNPAKKISELTGSEQNVDVLAKVVFVERKDITVKGAPRSILSGILGDETGTASFTVWEPGSVELSKGSVYNFRNCYCKMWNERVQVHVGNRGRIEAAPDATLEVPAGAQQSRAVDVSIADIREGMGNINVTGRIQSVEARRINSRGEEKTVWSGIMADSTGKIQFSAWRDFSLAEGRSVTARNCYVKSWKGIPQLNMGDRAEVEPAADVEVGPEDGASLRTVADVVAVGGGLDVSIEGTIVDVKNGSGLIKRCPQCKRSLLSGTCVTHGEVQGVQDMRMKVVVDDGTGAIGAVLNRSDTESLTGVSMNAAVGLAAARGEDVALRELTAKILLRRVRLTGNVLSDDYGPSMIVASASGVDVDLRGEAEALLKEVEGAL